MSASAGAVSRHSVRARRRWLLGVGLLVAVPAVLGVPTRSTYGARTSGDEPQYLLSALSLARDVDLDISDEIEGRSYEPFHEITLDPQTVPLDERGRQISPHDPLLPVVLALPMGVGGWPLAKGTMALVAGSTAALAWWVAVRRFGVDPRPAALVVVAAGVSPPLVVYGSQVYPELPAALAVLAVVALLTGPARLGATAGGVAGICALPWLSVKYVPVAAVLALALVAARRHRPRQVAAVALALVAMAAVYLVVHRRLYGGWTVYAAGDHFSETGEFSVVGTEPNHLGRARRLAGLLIDRRFGLVPWSPLWLALVPAAAALVRRRPPAALVMLGVIGAAWTTATFVALTMHGWWWPGRQVVVVLPLAAVVVAWWAQRWRPARSLIAVAGVLGLSNWLWLALEASTGRRTIIVDFFDTAAPAYRLAALILPDGMAPSVTGTVLTALWWLLLVALAIFGWRSVGDGPALRARSGTRAPTGQVTSPVTPTG